MRKEWKTYSSQYLSESDSRIWQALCVEFEDPIISKSETHMVLALGEFKVFWGKRKYKQ